MVKSLTRKDAKIEEGGLGPLEREANKPLIMLIDDDGDFLELMKEILQPSFNIAMFDDSREALNCVGKLQPDLIVTDIVMPLMNGYALINELRKFTNKPILGVSGAAINGNDKVVAELGANGFIDKTEIVKKRTIKVCELLDVEQQKRFGSLLP